MSSILPLGRLELVSLRSAWPSEAQNFTPWLAEDGNLAHLGEVVGLQLELEAVEKQVGPFAADILAKEIGSGRWVLIENQIEPTDHRHLGQLLTYAAGLDAHIIIWIAERFREEHRAAIDFLNRATNEEFAFFGIQVELYRIGDSALAPSFTVMAKPNNWSKQAQAAKRLAEGELSPTQLLNREFWAQMIAQSKSAFPPLSIRTAYKTNWQPGERLFSAKDFYADANAAFTYTNRLRVEVYLGGKLAKKAFQHLRDLEPALSDQFGHPLTWEELPSGQDSRISFYMPGTQKRETKADWPTQQAWLFEHWPRIAAVFRPHLAKLDLDQLSTEDEQETELGQADGVAADPP